MRVPDAGDVVGMDAGEREIGIVGEAARRIAGNLLDRAGDELRAEWRLGGT